MMIYVNDSKFTKNINQVHKNLEEPASNVCKSVELFGTTIEKLLIKHGKVLLSNFDLV